MAKCVWLICGAAEFDKQQRGQSRSSEVATVLPEPIRPAYNVNNTREYS
jgi:hypothetical protein